MSVKTFLSNIASYWESIPSSEKPVKEVLVAPEPTTEAPYVPVGITQLPYPHCLPYKSEDRNDPTVGFIIPVTQWRWVISSDFRSGVERSTRGIGVNRGRSPIGRVTRIEVLSVVTDPSIFDCRDYIIPGYMDTKPPVYHCVALDGRDRINSTGTPAYKGFRFFLAHSTACDMINEYLDTDNPDRMVVFTDWYRRMEHLTETKVG